MAFEDVLQWAGDTGCFQVLAVSLGVLIGVMSSSYEFLENFTAGIPEHRCSVHLLDNPNPEANVTLNLTVEALLRASIPMDPNGKPEQCRRFRQIQWQLLDPNASAGNNAELETEPCLDGWTYDQSVFTSTIVSEWDLVCNYQSFKYLAHSITLMGYLLGITVSGFTSDRYGRKPLLVFSCLACGVLSICCGFVPTFSIYCTLKFLSSAFVSVIQTNLIIIVLEVTAANWKPVVVASQLLSGNVGHIFLGGLAYAFRDWRRLQWVFGSPFLIFFLFSCCCFTESIRWLLVTGKTQQAAKELKKIAYINGKKDVVQNLTTEALISKMGEVTVPRNHFQMKQIIVNPIIFRIILCGFILWSTMLSIFTVAMRLGGTVSALVLMTKQYFIHLPGILYGVLPLATSVCILFLPETFNLPLADTIKDIENRFRSKTTREKQRRELLRTTEC
ncbi:solute carrier family 22 member 22-like isoform X2 [Octodon degus]|uniref:Solute carrier family 22 member 22-like isoform X2 n=1 Tax=Octodon degus TaxID=10160 RepID=A0A6P6EQH0_OCTDE|nr:solute carrier family 22 member 22-like isoform X2 [Octodon degus]